MKETILKVNSSAAFWLNRAMEILMNDEDNFIDDEDMKEAQELQRQVNDVFKQHWSRPWEA